MHNTQPYKITWFFTAGVLITGLFFPYLMDHDAPEYAAIAAQMHYRNDWVNILNHNYNTGSIYDYLDKPHHLFWSAMLGYKLFGVHDWSYRLITVLVSIAGAYGTSRLGKLLYNETVGKMAAIFFITAQAIMLSNHDVRTDSLLTSFVALAVWQFAAFVQRQKLSDMAFGAIFLAGGVGAKGMIAVMITACVIFFYIAGLKKWKIFINWKWLPGILVFFIALSPVLYFYYLQFDLHPEKISNGKAGMSGVKFLLWTQSFERFAGDRAFVNSPEFSFFFHTFLWAFLPWSILTYTGAITRFAELIKTRFASFFQREQLTFTGVWAMFCFMSLAKFKLPHYINILFPMLAVFTAGYLYEVYEQKKQGILKALISIQTFIIFILAVLIGVINIWAFPIHQWWIMLVSAALFIYVCSLLLKKGQDKLLRIWFPSAVMILLTNFILNTHFYPAICQYQAGNVMAGEIKKKGIDRNKVYFYKGLSRSFDFYSHQWKPMLSDEMISEKRKNNEEVFLFAYQKDLEKLLLNFNAEIIIITPDYHVTTLTAKFINPVTRDKSYDHAYLLRIK